LTTSASVVPRPCRRRTKFKAPRDLRSDF
jgi:hypothetical protein